MLHSPRHWTHNKWWVITSSKQNPDYRPPMLRNIASYLACFEFEIPQQKMRVPLSTTVGGGGGGCRYANPNERIIMKITISFGFGPSQRRVSRLLSHKIDVSSEEAHRVFGHVCVCLCSGREWNAAWVEKRKLPSATRLNISLAVGGSGFWDSQSVSQSVEGIVLTDSFRPSSSSGLLMMTTMPLFESGKILFRRYILPIISFISIIILNEPQR